MGRTFRDKNKRQDIKKSKTPKKKTSNKNNSVKSIKWYLADDSE